ncbi:hypothetical protein [Arthrobacter sp. ov118]|jgi:hypothetical protein|uniref:hypothetical protein n=1 Tax=Arthrobacter sp. ov118 TaxID=1761747 RepID=UPI0008EC8BE4|nr:hypothetical protein [Arthrobacter sp. ov118]SFT95203.1 hypothetical protein SAMN04487915_10674 [Arthrobacter sp. ov118]
MSPSFHGFRRDGERARIPPVMCEHCGTDSYLVIRSVTELPDHPADVVMVSYTCERCRLFREHPARVADLCMVLGRAEPSGDVLIFGGYYLHCGRPMARAGSELRRLSAPKSTEGDEADTLEVYLSTRVLRCACGFQMELPE